MTRKVKMTPEVAEVMERQRKLFIAIVGRSPGPGDPVFFDPDEEEPKPLDMDKVRAGQSRSRESDGSGEYPGRDTTRGTPPVGQQRAQHFLATPPGASS